MLPRLALMLLLLGGALLFAEDGSAFRVHGLFSNHMVLQRGKEIVVAGFGGPAGATVTAEIAGHRGSGKITSEGWRVVLPELPAGGPHRLVIDGPSRIVFDDVLVGDVWLASGQSNMHLRLRSVPDYTAAPEKFTNSQVRFIRLGERPTLKPSADIERAKEFARGWVEGAPGQAREISAVGWVFADRLQREFGVPVGLIHAAHGATRNEAWMPEHAVRAVSEDEKLLAKATDAKNPWIFYNGLIAPLIALPLKGFIWYQGEANGHAPFRYEAALRGLIRSWREAWRDDSLPFYLVQLPSYPFTTDRTGESWAWIREAQAKVAASEPKTALAVTLDLGEFDDIHPLQKAEVGRRLAVVAIADLRGERAQAEGPALAQATFEAGRAVLTFANTRGGLQAKRVVMNRQKGLAPQTDPEALRAEEGVLLGFSLAGADGNYHAAEAEIRGDQVIVRSAHVARPESVRYGWANFSLGNLANGAGFFASPFRTDSAPMPDALKQTPYWARAKAITPAGD